LTDSAGRRLAVSAPRIWATPLEALLIGERAALLSGHDDDFTLVVSIAYTGMRWGETIGLERDREFLQPTLIKVEWQLREIDSEFHWLPPKDDSYRSLNWEPRVPVDLPPFLGSLLSDQARAMDGRTCRCAGKHEGSGRYLFLGPDGGHHRRSDYARRVFRPACDGRHLAETSNPGKLVIADMTQWPGKPVAAWHPAPPDAPFTVPSGRGLPKLVNPSDTGRCPSCSNSFKRRTDGNLIKHQDKKKENQCEGSYGPPAEDPPLAAWLPVKPGLTPHGLRHSHKTWMVEDGIPEILSELRLGHEIPGMRGLYSHVSLTMREDLRAALQARWETSLRQRALIAPTSPVPVLDKLLAPIREQHKNQTGKPHGRSRKNLASQIPPNSHLTAVEQVA
jgi:integrase